MGETFYLDFQSDSFGKVYIDEPIGFNALSFDFMQKDKGHGRDITFNGGEAQLEFSRFRTHYLDKLLYYYNYFGFESKVKIGFEFLEVDTIIGDLDFSTATTDEFDYFKCKVIQISEIQIIKRRESTKVNLFDKSNIDNLPLDPLVAEKIYLKAKAHIQSSRWEQSEFKDKYNIAYQGMKEYVFMNPCTNIVKTDLMDTFTLYEPFKVYHNTNYENYDNNDYIFKAVDPTKNINISIKYNLKVDISIGEWGTAYTGIRIRYGDNFKTATQIVVSNKNFNIHNKGLYEKSGNFNITIPSLKRGEKIWVYFYQINDATGHPDTFSYASSSTTITNTSIDITGESKSYDSVIKGIRLIDVMKRIITSIGGLPTYAPRYDIGGEFYNTFLTNGSLLRQILDRSFGISLEDIMKSLTEHNADYEVNDTIFFGIEEDYYKPIECGFFDNTQFHEYNKKFNPKYSVNEFTFKYKNYQALKERERPNTADTVHGESKMTLFNKNVENKKIVDVEWIRDSFLIDEARRKALEITKDTSYKNDDDIFAIDIISYEDTWHSETTQLFHEYNETTHYLSIKCKEELNFINLGLEAGKDFKILSPDKNAGSYIVHSVSTNELVLEVKTTVFHVPMAYPNKNNNGERYTDYQYLLGDVFLTNRTNEEITNFGYINSPNTYANLVYSVRRNIENYYSSYLSSCNLYHNDKFIKTTWYKNNKEATFTYNNKTTEEGSNYAPITKLLAPYLHQNIIFANVELVDFFTLQNLIRTDRGYIRFIDKNDRVVKVFPTKMNYEIMSKELSITGEEKYEPADMTISTDNDFIIINNETTINKIVYEIKDDKVYIYDINHYRLYNGVYWNKVSINGGFANNVIHLTELLNLL